ncbi:MAG: acyl-CoA desaturase [Gemmataceae bacterium]|nr:acyl-CoA desaturase [Gemmataceae bacterium]
MPIEKIKSINFPNWLKSFPFIVLHLACLSALFVEFSWSLFYLCLGSYLVRMFGITAGYHRYFSHRAYKTTRWFQFVLAWLGCSALQKGPLWWASHHRDHHKYSDTPEDPHSPHRTSFWWSHVGWVLSNDHADYPGNNIQDFSKYPELRFLSNYHWIPGIFLAVLCYLWMGFPGLVWGFFVSTVLVYHCTFFINSLTHLVGVKRFETSDESRNSLILAILTMGEGWHNNHHHYQSSANQGFYWWEIDLSYYILYGLSCFGIVWELRKPGEKALNFRRRKPIRKKKKKLTKISA